MGEKRFLDLVERTTLNNNDFFAVDKAADGTKKVNAGIITNQFADINNILGAKNILRYPYYSTTKAESGMVITDNGDGSITISGTATARVVFRFADNAQVPAFIPPVGTYKLVVSGNSAGLNINFDAYNNVTWVKSLVTIHGNGISASFDVDYNGYDKVTGYIDIPNGTAITSPITIKPMIMPAYIEDTTWEPYAKTNAQLTSELGNPSAASGVSGSNAFAKIASLNNDLPRYYDITVTTVATGYADASKSGVYTFANTIPICAVNIDTNVYSTSLSVEVGYDSTGHVMVVAHGANMTPVAGTMKLRIYYYAK